MNQLRAMKKVVGSMGDVGVQMRLSFMQRAGTSPRKGLSGERNNAHRHRGQAQTPAKGWMPAPPSCSVTLAIPSPLGVFHL